MGVRIEASSKSIQSIKWADVYKASANVSIAHTEHSEAVAVVIVVNFLVQLAFWCKHLYALIVLNMKALRPAVEIHGPSSFPTGSLSAVSSLVLSKVCFEDLLST